MIVLFAQVLSVSWLKDIFSEALLKISSLVFYNTILCEVYVYSNQ